MKQITINLPDTLARELERVSEKLGIRPDELLLVSLQEKVAEHDAGFSDALKHVLQKNAELYRRLAQ